MSERGQLATAQAADRLLTALGEQLSLTAERFELVIVGGSALLALGLVSRTTRDIDVVALIAGAELGTADPLPPSLVDAVQRVGRDFGLPADWLNAGPADLFRLGLPDGFGQRLTSRSHGPYLTAWYASRLDQIHLKLYAAVDQGPGKHERDLRALHPTTDELMAAARWSRTHDPSDGYRDVLVHALSAFGIRDVGLDD